MAWISTKRKPVMPRALREFSQPSGTFTPKLLSGPKLKLNVSRINAASDIHLFVIKKGKSFQGTVPAIWYLRTAYPKENTQTQTMIIPE